MLHGKACEESPSHLLLHCGVTREVWTFFFALFGLYCVLLRSIPSFCKFTSISEIGRKEEVLETCFADYSLEFGFFRKEGIEDSSKDKEEDAFLLKSRILSIVSLSGSRFFSLSI